MGADPEVPLTSHTEAVNPFWQYAIRNLAIRHGPAPTPINGRYFLEKVVKIEGGLLDHDLHTPESTRSARVSL